MKFYYYLIIFFFIFGCSFDNKTGIWKDNTNVTNSKKKVDIFVDFKRLSLTEQIFDETIEIKKNFKFDLQDTTSNFFWRDIYYSNDNNYKNFKYNEKNLTLLKSKKLSRSEINEFILFDDNNLISSDVRGNIIIYSLNQNKIITKFNFYKKKYKGLKKKLNMIIEKDVIYVSDNLGYLYAFDYKNKKIIWAKNYRIPFRSNLKLYGNKLIASNQDNNLFFFNKNDGFILRSIPTEETVIKNKFINNLSLDNNNLYFLNTYGSLYSINANNMSLSWVINLNPSLDLNTNNLFNSAPIINHKNIIVVASNNNIFIINKISGAIYFRKNFSISIKPIILKHYLFLITKNNFLIAFNLNNNEIIYSYNINKKIDNFLKKIKSKSQIIDFLILNNKIYIILKNSNVVKLSLQGKIENYFKLPSKVNSKLLIINDSIFYINKNKKFVIVD